MSRTAVQIVVFALVASFIVHVPTRSSDIEEPERWSQAERLAAETHEVLTSQIRGALLPHWAEKVDWELIVTAQGGSVGMTAMGFLRRYRDGELEARILKTKGLGLTHQLYLNIADKPIDSADAALNTLSFTEGQCPAEVLAALAPVARALASGQVNVLPDRPRSLRNETYRILIDTGSGNRRQATMYQNEGGVASWIDRLFTILDGCAKPAS